MTPRSLLSAQNLYKSFPSTTNGETIEVLSGISLDAAGTSITTVVGSSGSGKSTLLHILGGLDRPTRGKVYFDGNDLNRMNEQQLAEFRNRRIGFVFQFHHLLPEFTALENVFMPALIGGLQPPHLQNRAAEMLEKLGVGHRQDHRPSQLSGGEQQRVAVARALMNNPDIIMADEPTGNLDNRNTELMLDLLVGIRDEEQITLLLVTHDYKIADRSDRVYELKHGVLQDAAELRR